MDITKKLNWQNIFIFLFLVLFPFGQILRIGIIQPLDVIVGLATIYTLVAKLEEPDIFQNFKNFLYIAAFTYVLAIFIFWSKDLLVGALYLFRLVAYFYFLIYVWNFASNKTNQKLLINSLISISVISAFFGWIQYFSFPDIKPFFVYGWDMHLFRLVGTFLDPTFLGLLIVFGLLITIYQYITDPKKTYLLLLLFLTVSLAFTYSRGSYLAFLAGIVLIGIYNKNIKKLLFLAFGLVLLVLFLPTSRNHSIELLRSFSAIARIDNYSETLQIVKNYPLLGVGFNNMCLSRQKFIGFESFASHACSGSDSSLLLVLATTGVLGLMSFIYLAIQIWRKSDELSKALLASLFVHSLFSNSLFYPWIMGYILIYLGVSLRTKIKS